MIITLLGLVLILNTPKLLKVRRFKNYFGIVISFVFFCIGVLNVAIRNSELRNDYFYAKGSYTYQVRINEPPVIKANSVKILVDVMSRSGVKTIGKSLIYIEKEEYSIGLNYGDVLLIHTQFKETTSNGNPFEFDYPNYLKLFNIHHQGYLSSTNWVKIQNSQNSLFKVTYQISNYLKKVIDTSNLNVENKAIAKALLLGQKDDLDKDVLRTYSSAGAMHVLAVSGLHVGIIMMILMFVLKPIKKIRIGKQIFVVLVLFGVWFYAFVTGLSPSVLRSSLMFSFIIIGKEIERETSVYQSILVSAFILIIIDPLVIFKVGFQLSYLAVLGIVYLQPKLYKWFYFKSKPVDYLWQISSVSIAAQIATFPLGLYYFHQFPNFFLISNLIVIPLAGLILGTGIAFLIFSSVPYLNDFILNELNGLLSLMNDTVGWVESLPFSITWGISMFWYEVVLIYFILLCVMFSFTLKNKKLFITSLVSFVFLNGIITYKSRAIQLTNQLVIYNIKDELAIDVFYGNKNLFLCSDSLIVNENKLLFNIKHNWYYRTGEESPVCWLNVKKMNESTLLVNDNTFSVLSNQSNVYLSDYIIVSDIEYVSDNLIKQWLANKSRLILHPKIKYYIKKKIIESYPDELYYDIKNKGAFIFSF